MKLPMLHKVLGIAVLLLFSFSCASDLDFDQVNDLKIEPVVVTNLAYFDVKASQFVDNGVEQSVFVDESTIDIFNDSFFRRRLKKVVLSFELENTINRGFEIDLLFLDRNDQIVHTINLSIPFYAGTANKTTKTKTFENAQLDILKKTTKIVFSLRMLPGIPLNANSSGDLKMRSGVTAYLVVE